MNTLCSASHSVNSGMLPTAFLSDLTDFTRAVGSSRHCQHMPRRLATLGCSSVERRPDHNHRILALI